MSAARVKVKGRVCGPVNWGRGPGQWTSLALGRGLQLILEGVGVQHGLGVSTSGSEGGGAVFRAKELVGHIAWIGLGVCCPTRGQWEVVPVLSGGAVALIRGQWVSAALADRVGSLGQFLGVSGRGWSMGLASRRRPGDGDWWGSAALAGGPRVGGRLLSLGGREAATQSPRGL